MDGRMDCATDNLERGMHATPNAPSPTTRLRQRIYMFIDKLDRAVTNNTVGLLLGIARKSWCTHGAAIPQSPLMNGGSAAYDPTQLTR